MRILLLNQAFYPDVVATAQYLTGLAEALAERGHEVARFREETEAVHPSQTEMNFLGLGPSDYVTELTRFSYDRNGTVLEVTVNAFPADGIRLVYEWSAS